MQVSYTRGNPLLGSDDHARSSHVHQTTASVEQRVDAIQAALDERGMKPGEFIEEFTHLAEEQWVPENGARVVAKAWTDPAFRAAPARQRPRRGRRARPHDAGASPPSGGAGEHADGAERHLLHAVLVHRLHDHRPAAGLVQGPGVPRARRSPVAHRAEGNGPRPAAGGRDPRVGHDRGHALHGAAGAAAATPTAGPRRSSPGSSRGLR